MINLTEDSRRQLVSRSRSAEREKGDGKTRYEKRLKSRFANNVRNYNKIDMNSLFRTNILTVNIEVKGETDDYIVTISFGGFLDILHEYIERDKGEINLRTIVRALVDAFNRDNVFIHCSCLHPDTRIKLLDGTCPTVSEMLDRYNAGETLYVYSVDEKGDFHPGEVEKVWVTGTTTEFIKVTLDNGEEILTTPDHPYMLRDGSYRIAENLSVGTSLMPLYTSTTSNGYDTVKLNSTNRYNSIYKIVAQTYHSSDILEAANRAENQSTPANKKMRYKVAIHHSDFNKHNNNPENLKVMTSYEHWEYHASCLFENKPDNIKEQIREKSRQAAIKRNSNPTQRMLECRKAFIEAGRRRNYDEDRKLQQADIMRRTMKEYYQNLSSDQLQEFHRLRSHNSKDAWMKGCFNTEAFTEAAKARGEHLRSPQMRESSKLGVKNYWDILSAADREARRYNTNMTKIRKNLEYLISNNLPLTLDSYNAYKTNGSPNISPTFNSIDDAIKHFKLNHKVIAIERITVPETPVYDIKVKQWENFAVDAGVILHNCPDWKYRFAYWATKDQIIAKDPENRPSDITNPTNKLGAGCKHVMLVLANVGWLIKVASVINNYIKYMEKHREQQYAKFIYPAIYGKEYEKPVQTNIFSDDEIETDSDIIDRSNEEGRIRGRFSSENQPIRNPSIRKLRHLDDEVDDEVDING